MQQTTDLSDASISKVKVGTIDGVFWWWWWWWGGGGAPRLMYRQIAGMRVVIHKRLNISYL